MIKTLKQTTKEIYNWLKEKAIRFKNWFVILICGAVVVAAPLVLSPPDVPDIPPEYITAPENNTYKVGVKNFQDEFKENITDDKPLQYKLDDKYISFKPTEMKWDNVVLTTVKSSVKDNKKYSSIFGKGIDLEMKTGERIWSKIISIDKLNNLGKIPDGTEFLEIEYEVDTNFIIDGWNKKDIFEITEKTRLGDYSYIEPAYVWDSYSEEVCEEIPVYDDTDTIIEEYITECETLINRVQIKSYFKNKDNKLIYTKQIPVEWIKNAQFPIWTDADVTYGSAAEFWGDDSKMPAIEYLDTNTFVVCWSDDDNLTNPDRGICKIGSVSDSTISYGSEVEFVADSLYIDVCRLTSTKFAVIYTNDDLLDDGYIRSSTVSGTTINGFGTAYEFETGDAEHIACANIASEKVLISYNDETNSNTGTGRVCYTSGGTSFTCGAVNDYDYTDYYPIETTIVSLATDKAVTCFYSGDDLTDPTYEGKCFVGTVSGSTITWGAVYDTNIDVNYGFSSLTQMDTDKFIFQYINSDSPYNFLSSICTVSTRTMTCGTQEISDGSGYGSYTGSITRAGVGSSDAVSIISNSTDSKTQSMKLSSIDWSGKTLTIGSVETIENSKTPGEIKSEAIDTDKIVICYKRLDSGECLIGDLAAVAARRMFLTQ